ncbi:MAG: hypothetical protein JWO77_498 [Ilumatobacteraceae bacterium]|nr:hypothetical protein [Ilumatobacteraceae bacterium]
MITGLSRPAEILDQEVNVNRSTSTTPNHRETADEAGLGKLSIVSLLAGLVTAYGTFAVVAAIAGSLLASANVDTEFRTNDWSGSGAVAALTTAVVLLIAYFFGGYVAGRMARRRGLLHGIALAITTLVVGAIAGGIVAALTDDSAIRSNLRSIGVPTSTDQITDVALTGALISLAAIIIGSILGALAGERWHTKFARRVDDPEIGASADERRRQEEEQEARRRRIAADPTVATSDDRRVDLISEERSNGDTADGPRYTAAEWRQLESTKNAR